MLFYNTVDPLLNSILTQVMKAEEFQEFRLVGGTALSLQLGHRISVDIDLFSSAPYGSIDFENIDTYLSKNFPFIEHYPIIPAMGKSYRVGNSSKDFIKLDVFYTDDYISNALEIDGIRMANLDDIVAMKVEVVQNLGRKKDFWDLHKLLENYSLEEMIALHQKRYPYSHDRNLIIENFMDFSLADGEPDPNCMEGKYWELIKLDFEEKIGQIKK